MVMLFTMSAIPWSCYNSWWPWHDLTIIKPWRLWITMTIPCHGKIVMFDYGCQIGWSHYKISSNDWCLIAFCCLGLFLHKVTQRKNGCWNRTMLSFFNPVQNLSNFWRHHRVYAFSVNSQRWTFLRHLAGTCLFLPSQKCFFKSALKKWTVS